MSNYSLATEILREENRRTRFWFSAFVVTFLFTIVREVFEIVKGGVK